MGNVINLGRARKRKREAAAKQHADENAIRHGRTRAERARERIEQERLRAAVDGARREPKARVPDASTIVALPREPAGTEPPADERAPATDRDDEP